MPLLMMIAYAEALFQASPPCRCRLRRLIFHAMLISAPLSLYAMPLMLTRHIVTPRRRRCFIHFDAAALIRGYFFLDTLRLR